MQRQDRRADYRQHVTQRTGGGQVPPLPILLPAIKPYHAPENDDQNRKNQDEYLIKENPPSPSSKPDISRYSIRLLKGIFHWI